MKKNDLLEEQESKSDKNQDFEWQRKWANERFWNDNQIKIKILSDRENEPIRDFEMTIR